MSLRLSNLFSSPPEDLPVENQNGEETIEVNDIPNYSADFDPRTAEILMDKETKIADPYTGGIYTGKWPRVMFREAQNNPLQPTWLGYKRNAQEGARPVPIPHDAWFRHAAIFGATGYGKTTLLKNIMIQWAYSGHGFAFIDPNGDGVMDIMKLLPEDRLDDVIYIEPETAYEKVVGFNFLEISNATTKNEREAEKEGVIDDLIGIVKDESYWGARMDGVFSNIARGMISSEKKYTLIDMYWVLLDDEYREKFVEDVDDPGVKKYTKVISEEMDQSDLEPLIRRLQKFVENQTIREIIAHDESSFDIKDAVEGNKIILVNNNTSSSDAQQMIATGVMRRIWSAVKARDAIPKKERKPFFLIVDEFDNIATEEANIGAMISEARKFRLSLTLCNQQPHQLPKEIQEDLLSTDNLISFNPKNPTDARYIMQRFGNYDKDDILSLDYYKAFCTIPLGQGSSDPFVFNTFPDYPPRRGEEEVEKIIAQSLEKYGGPKPDPVEAVNTRTLDKEDAHKAGNDGEVIRAEAEDETFEITERAVLETILTIELRQTANNSEYGTQIPTDEIVPELERRMNTEIYQSIPAQIIEKMSSGNMIELERKQNQLFVELTEEGREFLMSIDTGGGATGGGIDHRYALRNVLLPLTKAGYSVRFPQQEGEAQPDGIAKVPIELDKGGESVKDIESRIKEFRDKLESTYPEVIRISDGSDINIEAETSTNSKPKQTLKNLRKAVNAGNMCLLLTKDQSENKGSISKDAEVVYNALSEPEFVNRTDEDGNRKFYNMGGTLELEEDYRAIFRADDANQTAWWETEDGGLKLFERGGDNTELLHIEDMMEIQNLTRDDVKYSYRYDTKTKEYIVYINIGGTRQRKTYDSKEEFKNTWKPVRPPFVPEVEFDEMPTEEDWVVAVLPDDDKDLPVLKYVNPDGEEPHLVPLLEADERKYGEKISIEDATSGVVKDHSEDNDSEDNDQGVDNTRGDGNDGEDNDSEDENDEDITGVIDEELRVDSDNGEENEGGDSDSDDVSGSELELDIESMGEENDSEDNDGEGVEPDEIQSADITFDSESVDSDEDSTASENEDGETNTDTAEGPERADTDDLQFGGANGDEAKEMLTRARVSGEKLHSRIEEIDVGNSTDESDDTAERNDDDDSSGNGKREEISALFSEEFNGGSESDEENEDENKNTDEDEQTEDDESESSDTESIENAIEEPIDSSDDESVGGVENNELDDRESNTDTFAKENAYDDIHILTEDSDTDGFNGETVCGETMFTYDIVDIESIQNISDTEKCLKCTKIQRKNSE